MSGHETLGGGDGGDCQPGAADAAARVAAHTPAARPALRARDIATLVAWIAGCVGAGALVGVFFGPGEWYAALDKPTWNPPNAVFGPVWTLLYALLGLAAWLYARAPGVPVAERRTTWAVFALHAVLNLAWTPLFFGLQSPLAAFVVICGGWLALLWLTMRFGRERPLSGYLLGPQVLWVAFALILNGTIWLMND